DRPNNVVTTVQSGTLNNRLDTNDANVNWTGGWQFSLGYMFGADGCPGPGIGFTYWGLGDMTGSAKVRSGANDLSTTFNLDSPVSGPVLIGGNPASDFFNDAHAQSLTRTDRVNNFELNVFQPSLGFGRLQVVGLAGFRYFRFDERLTYGSAADGFGGPADDEAYLSFRTVNNLYGGQVGFMANYPVTGRLGIYLSPKVGLFGNQMVSNVRLFRGDGLTAFDIAGHK